MILPPIPQNEDERLKELYALRILDTEREEKLENLVELVSTITEAPMCAISFVDEHRQWFKTQRGFPTDETPREVSFCAWNLESDEPLLVVDAKQDARFTNNPLVRLSPGIRTYAGAPLRTRKGLTVGALCVCWGQAHSVSKHTLDVLKFMADMVIGELELRMILGNPMREQEARVQFMASIDHDVRTPLNAILGSFQAIDANPPSDAIATAANQGIEMTQLLISKLEAALEKHERPSCPSPRSPVSLPSAG